MTGIGALIGLAFGVAMLLLIQSVGPVWGRRFVLRLEGFWRPATPAVAPDWLVLLGTPRRQRIEQRQRSAGLPVDATAYLIDVMLWSVGGLAAGSLVLAGLMASGEVHQPQAVVLLLLLCVVSGGLLADRKLDTRARHRRSRAVTELPGVAERLAIAVSAGAALPRACELVADQGSGALRDELAVVVDDVRHGTPFDRALAGLGSRLALPVVDRFVDGLRIAIERGTPIVDVLHAQAADARAEARRALMEQAGRREVAMLVPVVFLVLPAVVVVALYPGFRELTTMV